MLGQTIFGLEFRRFACIAGIILAQAAFTAEPVKWEDLQKNIDSWVEGPVSLIITSEEKNVYGKLKTPEEKMQFIKIFWARRDPVLRTRENEFKQEFYQRVEYANKNFVEGNVSGWKTARGQVYLTFGPPSRIDRLAVPESSRPAQLWVYDKLPSKQIPPNEALMFVFRDFKYVLLPPNPQPGDAIAAAQRALDAGLTYQSIPSVVSAAMSDAAVSTVIDERKNFQDLLFSVESTEKFGLAEIEFDVQVLQKHPVQTQVVMKPEAAPVYDDGDRIFAEFFFKQELKKGDTLIAANQHTASFSWDQKSFAELKEVSVKLPVLEAPAGDYDLWVTVGDRISNVGETRRIKP